MCPQHMLHNMLHTPGLDDAMVGACILVLHWLCLADSLLLVPCRHV